MAMKDLSPNKIFNQWWAGGIPISGAGGASGVPVSLPSRITMIGGATPTFTAGAQHMILTNASIQIDVTADLDVNEVEITTIGGATPLIDDADKLAVSVYGATAASPAGRTPILTNASGVQHVWLASALDAETDDISIGMIAAATPSMTAGGLHIIVQDPSDSTRQMAFDAMFKVPYTLDNAHHEIHDGTCFHTSKADTAMATAATLALCFKTAATQSRVHMFVHFTTLTGGHVEIIEGPGWTNQTGTKTPIYNRRRQDTMGSSGMLEDQAQAGFVASDNVIYNASAVSGGVVIYSMYAYGAKNRFSGAARGESEWVLNSSTQYVVKFTSDAASNKAGLHMDWYEHEDS